jgi:hypothetical protein
MTATRARTGRPPATGRRDVWDQNKKTGAFFLVENENWPGIDSACRGNRRGLKNCFSSPT